MREKKDKSTKRFNIIDVAIIIVVLLLIAGVVWQLFSAKSDAEEAAQLDEEIINYASSPHMRCTVVCPNVPKEAAEIMVQSEDTQINNNYQDLAAYIVESEIRPNTDTVVMADGTTATLEDNDTCTVVFVIEGYFDRAASEEAMAYKLGTQELRIGKSYIVKTKSIETSGYVTAMEVVNE